MGNPKLIVLDEPTAGLDPKERVRIREQIKTLGKEAIILVSTHVVSDIEPIADHILWIKKGTLLNQEETSDTNLEQNFLRIFEEECVK